MGNNIYRIVMNDSRGEHAIGHFTSKMKADIVLFQLNHRKNIKEKYITEKNINPQSFDSDLRLRKYSIEKVPFNDNDIQEIIRKESTLGSLKKSIFSPKLEPVR